MTVDVGAVHIETAPVPATVDVGAVRIETAALTGSATVDVAALRIETKAPTTVATVDVAAVYISLQGGTDGIDWWVCSGGVLVPVEEKLVAIGGVLVE